MTLTIHARNLSAPKQRIAEEVEAKRRAGFIPIRVLMPRDTQAVVQFIANPDVNP